MFNYLPAPDRPAGSAWSKRNLFQPIVCGEPSLGRADPVRKHTARIANTTVFNESCSFTTELTPASQADFKDAASLEAIRITRSGLVKGNGSAFR